VLQVAGHEAATLLALAVRGAPARLIATGQREPGQSHNVQATLAGADPSLLLLTPRTSWWTSTAERAGGIFAWLAALEALATMPTRRRAVVALATCGHELGHFGARHAFADEPALASGSALVVHLGASLGCVVTPGAEADMSGARATLPRSPSRSGRQSGRI
jgi:hypothetical protein